MSYDDIPPSSYSPTDEGFRLPPGLLALGFQAPKSTIVSPDQTASYTPHASPYASPYASQISPPFALGFGGPHPVLTTPEPPRQSFDLLIAQLEDNLRVYSPPVFATSTSTITLAGDLVIDDFSASPEPGQNDDDFERPRSEVSDVDGLNKAYEARFPTTDDDESNSVQTGQGSPSSSVSSSWANVARSNLHPGPKAVAHFKPIEEESGLLEEHATEEGPTKVETSRPIVKVSGLPGGFSTTDVKKMLRALGVRSSIIHFIINRRTFDKTSAEGIRTPFPIEDLYLEFKTSEYADVLVNAPRPTVAGKPVIVDRSDAAELRLALFPRLRNQTAKESYTLLSKEEIAALLDFCSRAEASFPSDNSLPFEHVCSILQKFSRMESDKVTDIQRNAVYDLGKLAITALHTKLSSKRGNFVNLQQGLLVKLVVAALTIPSFTTRQRYNVTKESGLSPSQVPADLQSYFVEPPKPQRYSPHRSSE